MPLTRVVLSLSGTLMVSLLTSCTNSTEDYCNALDDHEQALTELADSADDPQGDLFRDSLAIFEDLRAKAPDDLVDEWDTLVFAWEAVADAFDEAGVSPQDYQPGNTSGEVNREQSQAIQDAARALAAPRVVDAGDGIEQHANDVCKVDLGL